MKKIFYALVFLFIAFLVWKFGMMQPEVSNGWQTINKDGVILAYPESLVLAEAREPYYFLPNVIASLYTDKASYKPMNYSQDGRVIVSSAGIDAQACYQSPSVSLDTVFDEPVVINDREWRTICFSDAGAGSRYETKWYRLSLRGVC